MIWPFLFALLIVILIWKKFGCSLEENEFLDYFWLVVFAVIAFIVGILFASIIGAAVPKHWIEPKTTKLVSLRDSNSISGHFFLGTGSIETTQYYFFYKEAGQGGYQQGKVAVADNVIVFEEKRQNGELKTYTYEFVNPFFRFVAIYYPSQKYEFFIPEGSLKKNFVLQ